jgi:hypothetical protein
MTRALPVPSIDSALTSLETAAGRVTQLARAEQTAHADALPALISDKLAALETVNGAYAQLRDALVGTAFAEAPLRLADAADDRALRAHASAAFAALKNARAENELSRRVMQHKLNFTRTMIEAIRTLHDESGVAGLPGASPFQPSSSLRAGRTLGSA